MQGLKAKIIEEIIAKEGGYVDNQDDSGGKTNWGITSKVARAAGHKGPMRDMPRSVAEQIYIDKYWNALRLDDVEKLSPLITAELADTGVNMGTARAAEFLQRALNVFNQKTKIYDDLNVDGDIGSVTLSALKSYLDNRRRNGENVLFKALNCMQGAFYIELAEQREKDETFIFGWLLNRVTHQH